MKKRLSRVMALTLCILFTAALLAGCGGKTQSTQAGTEAPGNVYKWRMVTHQMPGTARYEKTIVPFVEAVKKASNGRLIIEPYGSGVLFPVTDSLESVKNGIVEMSAIWDGFWPGKDPLFALTGSIPADPIQGFSEHFYRAEKIEPLLDKAYEKLGVVSLGPFDFGPSEILMSTKPIKTLADFKGLNVRTGGISGEFFAKLGAATVSMPPAEIYTALQLGTVDAAEYNDWQVNGEMGLHEVTKYVIEPCLHTGPISDKMLIVNPKAWAELPEDLKAVVLAARDVARFSSATAFEVGSMKAKQDFIAAGVQIIELPEEEVAKARLVAFDFLKEYAKKSPDCAEYVKIYAEVLNDLGYAEEAKYLGFGQ